MANDHLNVCRSSASKFEYLQVQLTEKVSVQTDKRYWQGFVGKRLIMASVIIYGKPRIKQS